VTLAGSLQYEIGCSADRDPACAASHLTFNTDNGLWEGRFQIPAGQYGMSTTALVERLEAPISPSPSRHGSSVTFVWDQVTHIVTHRLGN
jgi:alpha-amylase